MFTFFVCPNELRMVSLAFYTYKKTNREDEDMKKTIGYALAPKKLVDNKLKVIL